MNKSILLGLLLACLPLRPMMAQGHWSDSLNYKTPSLLAIGGGIGLLAPFHRMQTKLYSNSFDGVRTHIDDISQYAPALWYLHLSLKKPEQSADHLYRFGLGTITYAGATFALKRIINVERPNGGEHSFPSGHTATVFFGAHLLVKTFYPEDLKMKYLAYGVATGTGFLRMVNNEHWAGDVLMGAAVGIASAELTHYFYPKLKAWYRHQRAISK